MAESKLNETAKELVRSFQEANQAIVDSVVAAQERNMKLAQNVYLSAMEVFKSQAESAQSLAQELEQQMQRQREAFQSLMKQSAQPDALESYMEMWRSPFAYYKQALEAASAATRQGFESFQQATQAFQKAAQQGLENVQKAAESAQKTAKGSMKAGKPTE